MRVLICSYTVYKGILSYSMMRRFSSTMFLLIVTVALLQCITGQTMSTPDHPQRAPCDVTNRSKPGIPRFIKNENIVPTNMRNLTVRSVSGVHECSLNTSDIQRTLQDATFPGPYRVEYISLQCVDVSRIYVYEQAPEWNSTAVIGYLSVIDCNLTYEHLENLLSICHVEVLYLDNTYLDFAKQSNCGCLSKISSLGISNIKFELLNIFQGNKTFPNIADVSLKSTSLSEIPDSFRHIFPNLQFLAVTNDSVDRPPQNFPWTNQTMILPLNLTRTSYYNSIISDNGKLPFSLFKRELILTDNSIQSIKQIAFHGTLESIDLSNNKIEEIGQRTFANVISLLTLKISNNAISSIHCLAFKNLVNLTGLILHNNKMNNISNCVFKPLVNLQYLDLSNNGISTLGDEAFAGLKLLQQLDLSNNKLNEIFESTFPTTSVSLKDLDFKYNELRALPPFIFLVRSLAFVDLSHNNIDMTDFNETIAEINQYQLRGSVIHIDASNKEISLKSNKIRHPFYISNGNNETMRTILNKFTFYFFDNSFVCDCRIKKILDLKTNETFDDDWKCNSPSELKDRLLMDVDRNELYCQPEDINLPKIDSCPEHCTCVVPLMNTSSVIVDCRGQGLRKFITNLPDNTHQLWLSQNYITEFRIPDSNLRDIQVLDISENQLTSVDMTMLADMKNLRVLRLNKNFITELPERIKELSLQNISLSENAFRCDCNTLWMKWWLLKERNKTIDWLYVKCNYKTTAKFIVGVPDDEFVCRYSFETISIGLVSSFVVVFVLLVLLYIARVRCKVLLYIYFGLHPFDNGGDDDHQHVDSDCVVLHSERYKQWVTECVVETLEAASFSVVDTARDFVVGMTFMENLTSAVKRSKRLILILADDLDTRSPKLKLGWALAMEKIKNEQSNFGIIVSRGIQINSIQDGDLSMFMKAGRFIDFTEDLCVDKLKYYMPVMKVKRKNKTKRCTEKQLLLHSSLGVCFPSNDFMNRSERSSISESSAQTSMKMFDAFLFYGDEDYDFVLNYLRPLMESNGFLLYIPDRDTRPGRRVTKYVNKAIHRSMRTIIVLSLSSVLDDLTTIVFIEAHRKSLRDKTNHLLVIVREDMPFQELSVEIRTYLKSYVFLHADDPWFETRLIHSLPKLLRTSLVRQDLQDAFLLDTTCL